MLNLSEDHALKPRAFVFAVMQKRASHLQYNRIILQIF